MAMWQTLEDDIDDYGLIGTDWSAAEYADFKGVEIPEASAIIQSYKTAQRGKRSTTKHVVHRVSGTRARSARWLIGAKAADVKQIGQAFAADIRCALNDAVVPDMQRIAAINPRAAVKVQTAVDALVNGVVPILMSAVGLEGEPG